MYNFIIKNKNYNCTTFLFKDRKSSIFEHIITCTIKATRCSALMRSCIAALILFAEDIRGETVEENVITKPDLTKTGLSEAEGTTVTRPVRRKSEKLRRLLEKRKHVLRKYESISERLKTIDESIHQEEEREILETFRNYGMDGSNLAVLLDQVQDGSDLAERLNAVFQELRVCAEKEDVENRDNQRKPEIENNLQHADRNNGNGQLCKFRS